MSVSERDLRRQSNGGLLLRFFVHSTNLMFDFLSLAYSSLYLLNSSTSFSQYNLWNLSMSACEGFSIFGRSIGLPTARKRKGEKERNFQEEKIF